MAEVDRSFALRIVPPEAVARSGVIVSALTHRAIALGSVAQDSSRPVRRRGRPAGRRSSGADSGALGDGSRVRAVSLADLVASGLLQPGEGVISVTYKGATHAASVTPDGQIEWRGQLFSSASAFTISVKRLATPDKQGDDGWKSAVYRGRTLDDLRQELRARLAGISAGGGGTPAAAEAPRPTPPPRPASTLASERTRRASAARTYSDADVFEDDDEDESDEDWRRGEATAAAPSPTHRPGAAPPGIAAPDAPAAGAVPALSVAPLS